MRGLLERNGYPRLQMLLLVSLTGGAGFLSSFTLLHLGLSEMWLRYLLALGLAYGVFLGLLWLWLRTTARDYADIPDPTGFIPSRGEGGHACDQFSGGGGSGGGGGASGSFDGADMPATADSGAMDAIGGVADGADELAIPIVLIAAAVALLFSSLWIVYSAPLLFAELAVDGVLAASLYRRLRGLEAGHWLETAVRRTWMPFLMTTLIVVGAGWGMQAHAPHAHSVGEFLAYVKQSS